jgi:uncharacterized membrane protein YphA (DoxX/SURF4 family)
MAKKTIERIVKKRLKWHKVEVAVLWLLIAIAAILIPAGIGVYFCVDDLAITQYVFAIPAKTFPVSQVKMLCNFAKVLGIVFALAGIAVIILALDRLGLTKAAYRMAMFISKEQG